MCNFMGYKVSRDTFIQLRNIEKQLGTLAALKVYQDGFKYEDSTTIIASGEDIEVRRMHWEFIPDWIRDMDALAAQRKKGIPWLNAKGETLLESKMFKDSALNRRCLVLATHFYEWRHFQPEGLKKPIAYPYVIGVNDPKEYFYMAGIWKPWTDKTTGETIDTFAVVTTAANELMTQVHNKKMRMPTILTEDLAHEWILEKLPENRIVEIATHQYDSKEMFAYTIRKDFKSCDDPLEQFDYSELPELVL
jgi:putative SOS response-associated peptidase YedK